MNKQERGHIYLSLAIALAAVARLTPDNGWILWALAVINFIAAIAVVFFSKDNENGNR